MSGPLAGLRVLDLTSVVMGPYATAIVADYGADVIHIEPPAGDVMRSSGPGPQRGMAPVFQQLNRNKRSVVLDLKSDAGRTAMLALCARADVLVHNVRRAAMERLGLGPADVRAANPRLIYVSLIGYGESGPYAGRPAYDDLIQGISAIPGLGVQAGASEARYTPLNLADRVVGLHAVHAILAAVIARDRTGAAPTIDVPMFESMAQIVLGDHLGERMFSPETGPPGYGRLLAPDRKPYRTRDGYVCALVYNDKQWASFFAAIGDPDGVRRDSRLVDQATRARNYAAIYAMLAEHFLQRDTAEWLRVLAEHDIPCVPMRTLDELIDDEHLAAAGFYTTFPDGRRYVGAAGTWDAGGPAVTTPAPQLGEHTEAVLREAGVDDALTRAVLDAAHA